MQQRHPIVENLPKGLFTNLFLLKKLDLYNDDNISPDEKARIRQEISNMGKGVKQHAKKLKLRYLDTVICKKRL